MVLHPETLAPLPEALGESIVLRLLQQEPLLNVEKVSRGWVLSRTKNHSSYILIFVAEKALPFSSLSSPSIFNCFLEIRKLRHRKEKLLPSSHS